MWIATKFVNFLQSTIQPATCDLLYEFRVFWQSPRSCKFYKKESQEKTHLHRPDFFLIRSPFDGAGSVPELPRQAFGCWTLLSSDLGFLYQRFSLLLRNEACQFRNQQSRTAVKLATIVLSGTRGPWLFLVIREGLGLL